MKASDKQPEEPLLSEDALPSFEDDVQWIDQEGSRMATDRSAKPNRRRGRSTLWMFVKVALFVKIIGLVLLCVAAFFARNIIIARAESKLLDGLEKSGVYLSYESPEYDFRRGLLLQNATLYETSKREKAVISISNLGVRVGVYRLIRDFSAEATEAEVTTRDATLIFFSDGREVSKVEQFDSLLFGTVKALEIDQANANINGLDVIADGVISLDKVTDAKVDGNATVIAEVGNGFESKTGAIEFSFLDGVDDWLQFSSVDGPPILRLRVDYDPANAATKLEVKGELSGQSFNWRDVPIESANVAFTYQEGADTLTFPAVNIVYKGGIVAGNFVYDRRANQMGIEYLHSTADIFNLAEKLGVSLPDSLTSIQYNGPPDLRLSGMLDIDDILASDVKIEYRHWLGMELPTGKGRVLPITQMAGNFLWKDHRITTDRFSANVLGGQVEVAGNAGLGEDLDYQVETKIRRLPLQQVFDYLNVERSQPGILTATFKGSGTKELSSLNGNGQLRVTDGELYKVPVIGAIQSTLASVATIFGQKKPGDLSADYAITNGVFKTDNLVAESDGTKIRVAGEYDLVSQTANFAANANLSGPLGLATGLVSKLLEVEGSGPVDNLDIRMKSVPSEFAGDTVKGMLELAGGASNALTDGVRGVGDMANDAVGGAVGAVQNVGGNAERAVGSVGKGAENAVKNLGTEAKKLGVGLGKLIPNRKATPLPPDRANGDPVTPEEIAAQKAKEAEEKTAPTRGSIGLVGPPDPTPAVKTAPTNPVTVPEEKPKRKPSIPIFSD